MKVSLKDWSSNLENAIKTVFVSYFEEVCEEDLVFQTNEVNADAVKVMFNQIFDQ